MSLYWFKVPTPSGDTLAEMLDRLRPLGVRWRSWKRDAPHATYSVRDGELVKDIGMIVVHVADQTINVYPYAGVTYDEMRILAGCAQEAFERAPSKATHWSRVRTKRLNRWQTTIIVRADEREDLVAQQIARSERRSAWDVRDHAEELTALIEVADADDRRAVTL